MSTKMSAAILLLLGGWFLNKRYRVRGVALLYQDIMGEDTATLHIWPPLRFRPGSANSSVRKNGAGPAGGRSGSFWGQQAWAVLMGNRAGTRGPTTPPDLTSDSGKC